MQRHKDITSTFSPVPNKHSDAQENTTPILRSQPVLYETRAFSAAFGLRYPKAVAVDAEKKEMPLSRMSERGELGV